MSPADEPSMDRALSDLGRATPGLRLLLLFGSRARGDANSHSDWDLGYLADEGLDVGKLLGAVVMTVGTDRVDLVDLQRASGLLRFRAARDGRTVFETVPGTADRFRMEAATFWCDAAPILLRGYDSVLAELAK
jgi:predicted nucleotidyltransferase